MKRHVSIQFDEWQNALADANRVRADKIPPGFHTVEELAADVPDFQNLTHGTIRYHLRRLIGVGRAEQRQFTVSDNRGGRLHRVFYYRLTAAARRGAKTRPLRSSRRR